MQVKFPQLPQSNSALGLIAKAFGEVIATKGQVERLVFHPEDLFPLLADAEFAANVDRETQPTLIRQGVVGYFWGAVLHQSTAVKRGTFNAFVEGDPWSAEGQVQA
jgi:hypothetical protein